MTQVAPGFMAAGFPTSTWDGFTSRRVDPEAVVAPNSDDFEKVSVELIAVQQHLNALFSRTAGNNIKLVTSVYKSLFVPIGAVRLPTALPPTWTAYKSSEVLVFTDAAAASEERVHLSVVLPPDYKMGTDIAVYVHWVGEDATVGNVRWKLTYNIAKVTVAFGDDVSIVANLANGGADKHNCGTIGNIDMSAFTTASDLAIGIIGMLMRDSGNAGDTLDAKHAKLLGLEFRYQSNKLGSSGVATHAE